MSGMLSEAEIEARLQTRLSESDTVAEYSEIDATEDLSLRCAAVLILLILQDGDWNVLYTRRTQRVESHKGQVSFPGGACDDGETTPEQTALREAQEEIGVGAQSVRILGRLPSMISISQFRITPVVGVLSWPAVFRLNEHEVERIFTIPLDWLAASQNRWELPYPGTARGVVVYHPYDGELVWGATARMTVDFLRALGM
jgi:8-oxo-dGTP pyrophosphatase MutT (NUDIX family)